MNRASVCVATRNTIRESAQSSFVAIIVENPIGGSLPVAFNIGKLHYELSEAELLLRTPQLYNLQFCVERRASAAQTCTLARSIVAAF